MKEPSTGICKVQEYDNVIFYKAHCSCMHEKHEQTLTLDLDNDGVISLSIYSTIWTHYTGDWCDNWWEKFGVWYKSQKNKWKQVWTLITTSQIEGENEFMFHSEDQVRDYINALESGLEKLKQPKE